ncbi:alpha beta-hydrolase [Fusarium mundagurra]|uniref:Alpha beta-hydrolase n=1 Tax=Fusarium mundagurra TaxID=1567541 RepID=A0A8H5XPN3_9HYPO|nr:alpha beta-hydrolase [Fusarium mundagurra]
MDPSNFCVVFVPGAWHPARAFKAVGDILEHAGFSVDYVDLPSVGAGPPITDFTPDVAVIQQAISQAASKGQKVILVAHSYGGIPSAEAIGAFGPGGAVAQFVLCCSFIIPKDKSLIAAFGGQDLPWWSVSEDKLTVNASTPEKIFYNDLSPEQVAAIVQVLKPHSYQVFHAPLTYEGWRHVPTTYIYCSLDAAIPIHIQKIMVEETAKGVNINTVEINAGHSPFINMPEAVASSIQKIAK